VSFIWSTFYKRLLPTEGPWPEVQVVFPGRLTEPTRFLAGGGREMLLPDCGRFTLSNTSAKTMKVDQSEAHNKDTQNLRGHLKPL
jgi:hypothetical protein